MKEPDADYSPRRRRKTRSRTALLVKLGVAVALCVVTVVVVRAVVLKVSNTDGGKSPTLVPSDSALSGEQAYQRLIRCSVAITSPHGAGSGFVVDAERRLVVTNFHVVVRERRVAVVFPRYDARGELITDARQYEQEIRASTGKGEVVEVDEACDLALIRVDRLAERTAALPLARQPAATGSVVYSVGGSGAAENLLWRLSKGTVRGRVHRRQPADFGMMDCMILETDAPVNRGDSGGPVMNDRGELVAVVSHFLVAARQVSGNVDVEEVRKFVARHHTTGPRPEPSPGGTTPVPFLISANKGKIEGTKWSSLPGVVKGQNVPAGALKIEFAADGQLTYNTPIGDYGGTYSLGVGDAVTLDFDRELGDTRSKRHKQKVVINGTRMRMSDSDGTSLTFDKVP